MLVKVLFGLDHLKSSGSFELSEHMSTKADKGVATGCFPMKNPFGSKKDPGSFDEKTRSLRYVINLSAIIRSVHTN